VPAFPPLYSSQNPQLVQDITRNRRFWTSKSRDSPDGILFTVGLYLAIEKETSNRQVMDRAEAQRQAQRLDGRVTSRQREEESDEQEDGSAEPDEEEWGYSRLDDEA